MLDEVVDEEQNAIPLGDINPANWGNELVVGTTRSGKTVEMLHEIEYAIKHHMFTFIISGKNGAHDPYSMRQVTEKLCKKYGVPFFLISTSPFELIARSINPFADCDTSTVVDILSTVTTFSEEHYLINYRQWIMIICDFLLNNGEHISLDRIVKSYDYKDFVKEVNASALDNNVKKYLIDRGRSCSSIAADSKARIAEMLEGRGKAIFGYNNTITISKVRSKNAVLMLDLDGLDAPELSLQVATLCLGSLAHIISNEPQDTIKAPKLIVLDELSIFFCKYIPRIYGLASGYGYKTISGTQSFSDLDKLSPFLKKETVENSQQFVFLLQNEPEDAEYASAISGTKHSVVRTKKTEGIDYTPAGMQKISREYKIHPDHIKALPTLCGYYYQKLPEPKLVRIKLDYVDCEIHENEKPVRRKYKKISKNKVS